MNRVVKWWRSILCLAAVGCSQSAVLAHAPILLPKTGFSLHHSTTSPLANYPVSGSSRVFAANLKTLVGATIKNTFLNAPLNNISGQFTGVDFYSVTSAGGTGVYYREYANIIQFGTGNSFSTAQSGLHNFSLVNSISGGGPGTVSFIPLVHGYISGAQRTVWNYYGSAAAAGYNTGISMLEHPTGGLLFGTGYYGHGFPLSYPAFEAFGNNPYVALANNPSFRSFTLTSPLQSYIQYGNLVRPITSGFISGTYYGNFTYDPPYSQPALGPYYTYYSPFALAIGSNPFNTLKYITITGNPYASHYSYLK